MFVRKFVAAFVVLVLAVFGALPVQAQQTGRVTGQVVDAETGQPLSGVQVYLEGTTTGVLTQENGRYLMPNVRPGTYSVMAQLIGRATARRDNVRVIAGQAVVVDFRLRTTVLTLEEVVATGVTDPIAGVKNPLSIGKISTENIKAVPTTGSAANALQGKVAGATIVRSSGQPGEGVSILLRTPTNIMEASCSTGQQLACPSNSPMFVVDGVILSETIGGTTVDLESLDIESIEVVKGAAAASLYGSRAAAGVVNITTSRGRDLALDQTRVTVRNEFGTSWAPKDIPLSTHHQFRMNEQGQWLNAAGQVVTRTQRAVDADNIMDNPFPSTFDNVDEFFRPARFMTNTVNLSHNGRSTNFLFSVNQFDQQGALATNDGFLRRDFRVNLDHRLAENFNFSVSTYHSRYRQDGIIEGTGEGGVFWDLILVPADVNLGVRDASGNLLQQPDSTIAIENPLWNELAHQETERRARTLASADVRYTPLSWLNFAGNVSYDRADEYFDFYTPKGTPTSVTADVPSDGRIINDSEFADALNANVSATVLRNFGALTTRSTLRALSERQKRREFRADGTDLHVPGVPDLNVAATRTIRSEEEEIRANGYLVQTGLDYAGKYIGDFLVRRDGSSLFGANERWHTFYRAAAAYRLGAEPWFPLKNVFSEFKVRLAQGTAGGRPGFAAQYETWSVDDDGTVTKGTLGNKDLKPQITTEREYGIDMIIRNRVSVELTYARQKTVDQIYAPPLPAVFGYSSRWFNAGSQSGNTYEATVQADVLSRKNLRWSMTFVADRMRSKIDDWQRACFLSGLQNYCSGSSLSEMHGNRFLRNVNELPAQHAGSRDQFQVNDDGYLVWVGTGNTTTEGLSKNLWGTSASVDGRTYFWGIPIVERDSLGFAQTSVIGNSSPDFQLGWLNNINFHNFEVHTQFHAQVGGNVYNRTRQRMYQHERHGDLDQSGKSDEAKKTIAYYQGLYNAAVRTSHFVESGTYLKLRALSVRYRFGPDVLGKVPFARAAQNVVLGVIGRNIFTLTEYSGFDPEVGRVLEREDYFDYPNTRELTFLVEVSF